MHAAAGWVGRRRSGTRRLPCQRARWGDAGVRGSERVVEGRRELVRGDSEFVAAAVALPSKEKWRWRLRAAKGRVGHPMGLLHDS